MELMVRNGDYVNDGAGGFLRAEGTDELLQRVLWKLSIPRGSFPLLPALGSELHRLGRAKPAERAGLARQYVAQALSDEAELSVAGRVVPLSVFCDTGFHVQEPLSGRAVVLVRLDAVSLPPGVRAYLDACLAGVGAEPRPEWGVRFVPCQTVAGHCLLPALPAALASNGRKQDGIYAAFCDMPPPPGGWTALVSAETAAQLGK